MTGMRVTHRQKILCGALGGIAAIVLLSAGLVLQAKSHRFWNRFEGGICKVESSMAPPIDAVVQAVEASRGLVVLSVGSDQKVHEGYQFIIYRGDKFLGKAQVIKVYADLCGARILYTQMGESIQAGDQAATQL